MRADLTVSPNEDKRGPRVASSTATLFMLTEGSETTCTKCLAVLQVSSFLSHVLAFKDINVFYSIFPTFNTEFVQLSISFRASMT